MMNKAATWSIFVAISLVLTTLLILAWFLLEPLAAHRGTGEALALRSAAGLEAAEPVLHEQVVNQGRLYTHIAFSDQYRLLALDVPEYRGKRRWWVLLDPSFAVVRLVPRLDRADSALYRLLGRDPAARTAGVTQEQLDGLTGATVDRRLLEETLTRGVSWLVAHVHGGSL